MSKHDNRAALKEMARKRNTLPDPAVELIQPEVRTDMNFRVKPRPEAGKSDRGE
jgi:hypothetical protein